MKSMGENDTSLEGKRGANCKETEESYDKQTNISNPMLK